MDTGNLTPRSADVVADMRFTGSFGQPNGFSSVLRVLVRKSGEVCITLEYFLPSNSGNKEHVWSVELTNEQRKALVRVIDSYDPVLFEPISGPV